MRTTLRVEDELYQQAKARATASGISLTKLLENAMRDYLSAASEPAPRRRRFRLPVSTATGGLAEEFSTLDQAMATADLEADRHHAG